MPSTTALILLTLITIPATVAFPTHFPPAAFTNYTTVLPDQRPVLIDPSASITWSPKTSPSILLCSETGFHGTCWLILDNAPDTCTNLPAPGMESAGLTMEVEVGSVRVGGGAECAVFDGPACTGAHTIINTSALYTDLTTLDFYGGKVASLFCEPATSSEPNRARRTLVREGLRENDKVGGDERFSLEELQRAGG